MKEITEVIGTYNEYLSNVPKGALYIANALRRDDIIQALQAIQDFSEGALWLSQMSQVFKQQNILCELDITKLETYLLEANTGLENEDYVLVADMFEYEIAPFFEQLAPVQEVQ